MYQKNTEIAITSKIMMASKPHFKQKKRPSNIEGLFLLGF